MRSLVRALLAASTGLAAATVIAGPAMAGEGDAYHPAAAEPGRTAPLWERPRSTRFSVMRCSAGALAIQQLVLKRDDASASQGLATYAEAAKDAGDQSGAGGWALTGNQLKVSGDGFELVGRWTGPFLTATITRAGGEPVRCRFQVATLRSFTHYQ